MPLRQKVESPLRSPKGRNNNSTEVSTVRQALDQFIMQSAEQLVHGMRSSESKESVAMLQSQSRIIPTFEVFSEHSDDDKIEVSAGDLNDSSV